MEDDAEEVHDAGMAGQVQGDAVFPQKALQLGRGLGDHLQGHGSPYGHQVEILEESDAQKLFHIIHKETQRGNIAGRPTEN